MGIYYLPCVFCRWEADEFSYMSLHPWIGICLFHNIVLFFLFWRRLFCGEPGSREKTNNAQMIKGNRQGQAGSLMYTNEERRLPEQVKPSFSVCSFLCSTHGYPTFPPPAQAWDGTGVPRSIPSSVPGWGRSSRPAP